jgi:hypothetical protein
VITPVGALLLGATAGIVGPGLYAAPITQQRLTTATINQKNKDVIAMLLSFHAGATSNAPTVFKLTAMFFDMKMIWKLE